MPNQPSKYGKLDVLGASYPAWERAARFAGWGLRSALLAACLSACSADDSNPSTAQPVAGSGAGNPGTFTNVLFIFGEHNCGLCHALAPSAANGNLQFNTADKEQAYAALVGPSSASSACASKKQYVVPNSPETSLLLDKVANAMPVCGQRMPVQTAGVMTLSAGEIDSVRAWIASGAPKN